MIRKTRKNDLEKIMLLYQKVAKVENGIARNYREINRDYVSGFLSAALKNGLTFIATDPKNSKIIIAEIHCYKIGPQSLDHTLGNLTLVVDPDFHGQGIGYKIFSTLLEEVKNHHPNIARVELSVRQSNNRGHTLYQKLGFEFEGKMRKRITNSNGDLEDDCMFGWINPEYQHS
jgi:RimJ/RimL family protein N-acetyltransferase